MAVKVILPLSQHINNKCNVEVCLSSEEAEELEVAANLTMVSSCFDYWLLDFGCSFI